MRLKLQEVAAVSNQASLDDISRLREAVARRVGGRSPERLNEK